MGVRGELFTTQVNLDNRTYFFNVKENRAGDVFLQVVESKSKNGEDFDRRAIIVFAEDMQKFFRGLDESLTFIEKNAREKVRQEQPASARKKIYRKKNNEESRRDGSERSGRVHIVTKRLDKEKN